MTTLYLCEKPSQARDIAAVLGATQHEKHALCGQDLIVTWCLGHLLAQAPPDYYCDTLQPWRMAVLPIIPERWVMQPVKRTHEQLQAIEQYLKAATTVVIATDADREGDVIGREVLAYFNYQGAVKRLWLSALDATSIKKALANILPGEKTANLYQAGLGRQRADWLIGMNMTMAATVLFKTGKGVYSVGRVQTPTLKLVVDRDRSIANFKPEPYYELLATFDGEQGPVTVKWQIPEEFTDANGRCLQPNIVKACAHRLADQAAHVKSFADTPKTNAPPIGLSLSSLQKICNAKFNLSAKETLAVAQSLYETHKATTYPRTDCGYLPVAQHEDAKTIVTTLGTMHPELASLTAACDISQQSPIWNDQKITAHHAIIPTTNPTLAWAKFSDAEKKVYTLICRYYLAQFLGDYHYTQRKVVIQSASDHFEASSTQATDYGWKRALSDLDPEPEETRTIPVFAANEPVTLVNTTISDRKTKAPAYFTEGTLITAMKQIATYVTDTQAKKTLKASAGIGTEATRANILETLLHRQFLVRQGKQLRSTVNGQALIDCLPERITDPITTARWEQALDAIANGEDGATLATFYDQQCQWLISMIKCLEEKAKADRQQKGIDHACPSCGAPLRYLSRKNNGGNFWGCSAYPECKTVMDDANGKPAPRQPKAPVALSDITCPACNEHKLAKRQGKKGVFWGCSGYPRCQGIFWDNNGEPDLANPPKARASKVSKQAPYQKERT